MKKAAIITGAGSGIGAATALKFANEGYHVILVGRNEEKLKNVAVKIQSPTILTSDLSDLSKIDSLVEKIKQVPNVQIEVLINNAGIFQRASVQEDTEKIWQDMFQTNLFAPVKLTRLLIPIFQKNKKGSIVNVSSTLGLNTAPNTSAYSASKAAMINWTNSLAIELGSQNIRANSICPGIVDTPIHQFENSEKRTEAMKFMNTLQPLGRVGTPEDIAHSIYFLASDHSAWTTGAILSVDGGINLG